MNTSSRDKIDIDLNSLSTLQKENIDLLISVIDKSHDKNIGFIHNIDSQEEMSKLNKIRDDRKNNGI